MIAESEFVYRFLPGSNPDGPVLLLLHGTGGTEDDLIPLGQQLLPGAALISPRGKVLENGMPRFFRRLAEGIFDIPDLKRRTAELIDFVSWFRNKHQLGSNSLIAVGYSNGANIAASVLLLHPSVLSGAVLFQAMVPLYPDVTPNLNNTPVFISAGRRDPIVPQENTQELARMFKGAGSNVTIHWHTGGHQLGSDDLEAAKTWLTSNRVGRIAPEQSD